MTKEKNFQRVTLLLLGCLLMCMLTACSTTLNGRYKAADSLIEHSFVFEKDNKVKFSLYGVNAEGDYLIEDNTITITYGILGLSYDMEMSFEKKGKSIFMDGIEYIKEE